MNIQYKKGLMKVIMSAGFAALSTYAMARPNVTTKSTLRHTALKTTAVKCQPAIATIDLDINNVRAHLMTGGDMWWDRGTENAAYEIPKGSSKQSQFAASCWIGGFDEQKQLKVAAQTYRQDGNDYWPGALDGDAQISAESCTAWDNFWKVNRSDINDFIDIIKNGGALDQARFDAIKEWPATGNVNAKGSNNTTLGMIPGQSYAPFVDVDGDGIYDYTKGDYPNIKGDQFIWWVFNDAGNIKEQSQTAAIGVEVQTSYFGYASQDFLNDATFCNYRVINRGKLTMDSTYIAVWDDADLGWYQDDYIGCDTLRGLGIEYNGTTNDGEGNGVTNSYGTDVPQVGLDFFIGPTKIVGNTTVKLGLTNFTYYNNDNSEIGNPANGIQIYGYMTGSIISGARFSDDFKGPGQQSKGYGSGPVSHFVFWGDPGDNSQWSECTCNNTPGDRRFIFSSGPFSLAPGAANDITFGCVWAAGVGGCPKTSFRTITSIDDQAQALFENGFKTIEGPEAPRMVARELDQKVIFYLQNDYGSNNFREQFGDTSIAMKDSLKYHQTVPKAIALHSKDSLYKFEGYRVFQLADATVSAANIFDPVTGEVDNTKAVQVFECDVKNGVTKMVNFVKDNSIGSNVYKPQVKIFTSSDSGITHSFEVTQDAFAKNDKKLVNYKSYYFVALAYAYNDFAGSPGSPSFSLASINETQDVVYLGSAHGQNGTAIKIDTVMPNPTNGAFDKVLNSDFGSGVSITRIEGAGNGGQELRLTPASELKALNAPYIADTARYQANFGPFDVKVIDPVVVPAYDWELYINGSNHGTSKFSLVTVASSDTGIDKNNGSWKLVAKDASGNIVNTIYSEDRLGKLNEQILAQYGLSVTVHQVSRPGDEQSNGNGYISSDISFENTSLAWLAGVPDQADSNVTNWLRSGNNRNHFSDNYTDLNPCGFNDNAFDTALAYENLLSNYSLTRSTWGPYNLAAPFYNALHGGSEAYCGFAVSYDKSHIVPLYALPSVDVVFTSDKSKWTRCAVIEMQEDAALSEGKAMKFSLRRHQSWNGDIDASGAPVYSTKDGDTSFSYFPGYAINQETGERLNIVFGEDSYQQSEHGNDMIWNPTMDIQNQYDQSIIFGGKHYVYVLGTRYDQDSTFAFYANKSRNAGQYQAFKDFQWVGLPVVNSANALLSLKDGLIPTTTRIRFRVGRPYVPFYAVDTTGVGNFNNPKNYPYYQFSTKELATSPLSDVVSSNTLLDKIQVVPNPYYGYSGYENRRLDARVRITHLPPKATVNIYSLDGTLVRTLTKTDPNVSFLDWDIRNAVGLPIASGMYLMDVKAEGVGEIVLRWFGSMRPIDVTTY